MDREQGGRARISNRRSSSCSIGRMMLRMGPMGLIGLMGLMGLGDATKSPPYPPQTASLGTPHLSWLSPDSTAPPGWPKIGDRKEGRACGRTEKAGRGVESRRRVGESIVVGA
jgi:hypothetical protein